MLIKMLIIIVVFLLVREPAPAPRIPDESQSAARPSFLSAARASTVFISIIVDFELKC